MFDQRFLDDLCARLDIIDVVSKYVHMDKKGGNYFGLCPFHNEKTPSFSASSEKQIFHCFGCGVGGGVINFIMRIENLEFADAVAVLAKMAGMDLPEQGDFREDRRRERLLALNKEAARYFHETLKSPEGSRAAQYVAQRRLLPATVTRFGIGYAPDSWDGLIRAMNEKGYDNLELLDAGLSVKKDKGGIYDRFRGRLMFPIIDVRGNIIAFGGRVLDDGQPKYLNSPDTPVFNKNRHLFALNIAKKSKAGRLILAEGYMDVISLHQAGFDCAVASLGTSLTAEQARLMGRYTKEVVIAYDADGAGQAAAARAIGLFDTDGLTVRVLRIPGAKDPDEFIKKNGADAFARLLERSEGHMEYKLRTIKEKYNLFEDSEKVEFIREASALLAGLGNEVEREVYAARVAAEAGIGAEAILTEVKRFAAAERKKGQNAQHRKETTPANSMQPEQRSMRYQNMTSALAEEGILSLLIAQPDQYEEIRRRADPEDFTSPHLKAVYEALLSMRAKGAEITPAGLSAVLDAQQLSICTRIMLKEQPGDKARALDDYTERINTEKLKRQAAGVDAGNDGTDPLLEFQRRKAGKSTNGG